MNKTMEYYQECHGLYTDNEHGLVTIAESLSLKLLPPRKKITIMLIGETFVEDHHHSSKTMIINFQVTILPGSPRSSTGT